jgi:hypothetical protein
LDLLSLVSNACCVGRESVVDLGGFDEVGPVFDNPALPAALLGMHPVEGLSAVEELVDGGSLVGWGGGEELVKFDTPLEQVLSIWHGGERCDR